MINFLFTKSVLGTQKSYSCSQSFKIFKDKKNNNFQVISTGNKNDHRNSLYFDEINLYIKKNNLDLNYRYIGLVSYPEVLSLIYHSVALINPSKFEGRHSL